MEKAYSLAMEIADAVAKDEFLNSQKSDSMKNQFKERDWKSIKRNSSPRILNLHSSVFQKTYEILSRKSDCLQYTNQSKEDVQTLYDLLNNINKEYYSRASTGLYHTFKEKIKERITPSNSETSFKDLNLIKVSELLGKNKNEIFNHKCRNFGLKTILGIQDALVAMGYKQNEHAFLKIK